MNQAQTKPKGIAAIAVFSLAVVACGQAQESFEEGFDENYVEQFVATCMPEAVRGGAPAELAEAACTCGAERSAEQLTPAELMSPPDEKMQAIMESCANDMIDENGNLITAQE